MGETAELKRIWAVTDRDVQAGGYRIMTIDPNTGRETTHFTYIDEKILDLTLHDGLLYFTAGDNSVNAFDPVRNALVWFAPAGTRYEVTALADPWVSCQDGVCYSASSLESLLTAHDAKRGTTLWQIDLRSPDTNLVRIEREFLYILTSEGAQYPNFLMQIRRSTGEITFRRRLPDGASGSGVPLVMGTRIIVPQGDLVCYDLASGAVVWTFSMGDTHGAGTPILSNGRLFFQGATQVAEGYLYAIDPTDGHLLWKTRAGNDYAGVGTPRVYGDLVIGTRIDASSLAVASLRHIFIVDAATGAPIINYDDKGILGSRPVLNRGRLFFFGQLFTNTNGVTNGSGYFSMDAASGLPLWKNTRAEHIVFEY